MTYEQSLRLKEIRLTNRDIADCAIRAIELPPLRADMYTMGEGKLPGAVGELIAHRVIGGEMVDDPHYDILQDGKKIEVKTVEYSGRPEPEWMTFVAIKPQGFQECDFYLFVRLDRSYTLGRVVGVLSRDEFINHKNRVDLRKGEKLGYYVANCDCAVLRLSDLKISKTMLNKH